jgi:hypothetical protein
MTFAPLLADKIIEWISSQNIVPKYVKTELRLSKPETGRYPWESVKDWKK